MTERKKESMYHARIDLPSEGDQIGRRRFRVCVHDEKSESTLSWCFEVV